MASGQREQAPQIDASTPHALPAPIAPRRRRRAIRLVLVESTLWAAGNAVTTGALLMYFARDLGAAGMLIGIIAAVPEASGILRLCTPAVIRRLGNRKRAVIAASLAARLLSLGIPAVNLFKPSLVGLHPLVLFVAFLFASQACQWIGYVAYISWLSDVVPRDRWGRFFAARNVCTLLVVLVVPVVAGAVRDRWIAQSGAVVWAYAAPFGVGVALMAASLVPLALVPPARRTMPAPAAPTRSALLSALADPPFRRLVVYSGWLGLWSGLMQAPFFLFVKNQLAMGLAAVSAGYSLMRLCQLPISLVAGRLGDRLGDRPVLIAGLAGVAASVVFLLPASPERWWLVYGTFVCWGAWAAVNICQQNLMLAAAPPGENAAHIALFQAVGGLSAGLSGIAGGWLLDRLTAVHFSVTCGPFQCGPFAVLFLLSGIGRALAIAWLPPLGASRGRRPRPLRT